MVTPVFYGHPRFCNLDEDGWLACLNLSGVTVRTGPRATMRIAPDSPKNASSFKSWFTLQGVCQAGVPFTSSHISGRKTR